MPYPDRTEWSQHPLPEHVVFYPAYREIGTTMPFKIYDWQHPRGSTMDHAHDYFQIWYVVKGEFMHAFDDHYYRMVKGNLFIVPPYAIHRVDLIPGQDIHIIGMEFIPQFVCEGFSYGSERAETRSFDASYLEPFFLEGKEVKPKFALTGEVNREIVRLLEEMLGEFQSAKRYNELILRADLLKLLTILIRETAKQSGKLKDEDERVEKYRELMSAAITYVNEHYSEDLRLETVCRTFSISKSYFCQLFKRFTGKTYSDYLIDYRVHKAAELLLESDMSVTDIGSTVGFNDSAYFSRIFKRQTGVTPSHYKKKASSMKP